MLTHEDSEIADGLWTSETTGALRRVRVYSADRDAFVMSNYVAAGGAHHVTMATQGMDVYERMEFDRAGNQGAKS